VIGKGKDLRRLIPLERGYNLNVPARILLTVKFTFCPTRDFNELRVPKMNILQLLWATASSDVILDGFEGLGLLSRTYVDLLFKIVVLSRVLASRDLNFCL
jgi:hypothetical protein